MLSGGLLSPRSTVADIFLYQRPPRPFGQLCAGLCEERTSFSMSLRMDSRGCLRLFRGQAVPLYTWAKYGSRASSQTRSQAEE